MADSRFKDFLRFAIQREAETAQLYEEYAEKAQSAASKAFFLDMAKTERGHEEKLKGYLAAGSSVVPKFNEIEGINLSDYLVQSQPAENCELKDVFAYAMKVEQKACELYTKLAEIEAEGITELLFISLAEEEKKHKEILEREYKKECA